MLPFPWAVLRHSDPGLFAELDLQIIGSKWAYFQGLFQQLDFLLGRVPGVATADACSQLWKQVGASECRARASGNMTQEERAGRQVCLCVSLGVAGIRHLDKPFLGAASSLYGLCSVYWATGILLGEIPAWMQLQEAWVAKDSAGSWSLCRLRGSPLCTLLSAQTGVRVPQPLSPATPVVGFPLHPLPRP